MKSTILLCTLSLLSLTNFAQDSSFQLKDYQYRTPGFKALSIAVNFSGSISNATTQNLSEAKDRSFNLLPSQLGYARFISTDKRMHTSSFSFTPYIQSHYAETNGKATKSSNFQYNFTWNRNDRFYKNNKWFFEIGNQLSNAMGATRNKDSLANNRYNTMQAEDRVSLGFGKGRIEMVQDAQMALYILNDLQEQGLLQGPVRPEVARNFAKLITDINNKRVFDNRKRRIYELTQIESFLRSSALVTETDIRHFTIINDNWALAYNPGRLSGSDWFVRLQPSAGFQRSTWNTPQQTITTSRNTNKSFAVGPAIGYEKYVPVNLKWQRNFTASLSWQTMWTDVDSKQTYTGNEIRNSSNQHESLAKLYASYGIGYYPNNRTAINASLQLEANHVDYDNPFFKNGTVLNPLINFSADYFISYKTRLSAYWNFSYVKVFTNPVTGKQIEFHNFNTNISLGFSHIIF